MIGFQTRTSYEESRRVIHLAGLATAGPYVKRSCQGKNVGE